MNLNLNLILKSLHLIKNSKVQHQILNRIFLVFLQWKFNIFTDTCHILQLHHHNVNRVFTTLLNIFHRQVDDKFDWSRSCRMCINYFFRFCKSPRTLMEENELKESSVHVALWHPRMIVVPLYNFMFFFRELHKSYTAHTFTRDHRNNDDGNAHSKNNQLSIMCNQVSICLKHSHMIQFSRFLKVNGIQWKGII